MDDCANEKQLFLLEKLSEIGYNEDTLNKGKMLLAF